MFQKRVPMIYPLLVVLVLALLPAVAGAQTIASSVRVMQVDTSHYPEVTVYVGVTDASGQSRPNLAQADFTITEDGTPVEMTRFVGSGSVPIHTALVIDHSGSMDDDDKLEGAKKAAKTFVNQMRPGDQTMLIAFHQRPEVIAPFTNERKTLAWHIDGLNSGGCTAIYDSVIQGVDELHAVEGRRVLLLVTDGQDSRDVQSASCSAENGSDSSLNDAIAYAKQHSQPVYVVGLGKASHAQTDGRGIDETVLRRIADETGGKYFYAPDGNELVALYDSLSGSLHEEYALTYRSPRPSYDGTRRDIGVSVGGDNIIWRVYRTAPYQCTIASAGGGTAAAAAVGVAGSTSSAGTVYQRTGTSSRRGGTCAVGSH